MKADTLCWLVLASSMVLMRVAYCQDTANTQPDDGSQQADVQFFNNPLATKFAAGRLIANGATAATGAGNLLSGAAGLATAIATAEAAKVAGLAAAFGTIKTVLADIHSTLQALQYALTNAHATAVNTALTTKLGLLKSAVAQANTNVAGLVQLFGQHVGNTVTGLTTALGPLAAVKPLTLGVDKLAKDLQLLIAFLQGFANPAVANPGVTAALSPLTTGLSAIQQGLTALSGAISGFDSGLVSALSGALGVAGFPSFTDLNALGGLANEALGLLGQVLPVG
eukprot:jgi/Chrzof1/3247/Cz12g17080.t1